MSLVVLQHFLEIQGRVLAFIVPTIIILTVFLLLGIIVVVLFLLFLFLLVFRLCLVTNFSFCLILVRLKLLSANFLLCLVGVEPLSVVQVSLVLVLRVVEVF